MARILGLLHGEVSTVSSGLSNGNRRWLTALLEPLNEECGRKWPDLTRFTDRAENVLTLLTAVC